MFSSEEKIVAALTELGRRLHERGIEAELYLVGGGAMLLGYNRAVVTSDIDGAYAPQEVIEEIADAMADENVPFPLIRGWLNDQVVAILPRVHDSRAWQALNVPGLRVLIAPPEHLLAMKARAARGLRDFTDVAVLADTLGLMRLEQVWKTCEDVWGFDVFSPEVKAELEEFLKTRGLK